MYRWDGCGRCDAAPVPRAHWRGAEQGFHGGRVSCRCGHEISQTTERRTSVPRSDKFVDVWARFNLTQVRETFGPAFSRADVAVYGRLVDRVRETVAARFGLSVPLFLTSPTFFARISGDKPPVIENDEYWHSHIDTLQYGSEKFGEPISQEDVVSAPIDYGQGLLDFGSDDFVASINRQLAD